MSWSLISHAAAVASTSVTTAGKTTTGANLIILGCNGYNFEPTELLVSDSNSNLWLPTNLTTGSGVFGRIFYCINPTVGAGHTFSLNDGAGSYPQIYMQAWSGPSGIYLDQQNAARSVGTVSSVQPGSITPAQNGELLLALCMGGTSTAIAVNQSFNKVDENDFNSGVNFAGVLAYLEQATAAAVNPTFSLTGGSTGEVQASIASFGVLPSGGGVAGSRIFTGM